MENTQGTRPRIELTKEAISAAAMDEVQSACRRDLAQFSSATFREAGAELNVLGHLLGTDRVRGVSPFGHGNDETVAVSMLLLIGSELISASADLFASRRAYAAAALVRQMVEVEYLAWAFETRDGDAERWLRSDKEERQEFFKPAKLRAAAQGKFRSKDYGHHCDMGGHPTPVAGMLLSGDAAVSQLLLSDLLGHVGRIWDHLVGWARESENGAPILVRGAEMSRRFQEWKALDALVDLPPP